MGLQRSGPQVAIIMGSDSDLPCMKEAAIILEKFKVLLNYIEIENNFQFNYCQVSFELTIVSAHRTPTRMYSFAQNCAERGIKVLIVESFTLLLF